MANDDRPQRYSKEHLGRLLEGADVWNSWRTANPEIKPNLKDAPLKGANLNDARLQRADLRGARLDGAFLNNAYLEGADLRLAHLEKAQLVGAHLEGASLSNSHLQGANFCNADLTNAEVTDVTFDHQSSFMRYWNSQMRGNYKGIRGIDSCWGNALFKRAAADQDFLDTLERSWERSRARCVLFWLWWLTNFGRSLIAVMVIVLLFITAFAGIYWHWPEMLGTTMKCGVPPPPGTNCGFDWFTPIYFSIVTFTTLGFGDINAKGHFWGELTASAEVLIGYSTLGLLLSVLADKVARRS